MWSIAASPMACLVLRHMPPQPTWKYLLPALTPPPLARLIKFPMDTGQTDRMDIE